MKKTPIDIGTFGKLNLLKMSLVFLWNMFISGNKQQDINQKVENIQPELKIKANPVFLFPSLFKPSKIFKL